MPDRFKYSEVRQEIINALRTDLMGPQSENEILDENPKSSYIIGMLASQIEERESSTAGEQEVDSDIAYGDSEDYTAGEDDDNEPIMTTSTAAIRARCISGEASISVIMSASSISLV